MSDCKKSHTIQFNYYCTVTKIVFVDLNKYFITVAKFIILKYDLTDRIQIWCMLCHTKSIYFPEVIDLSDNLNSVKFRRSLELLISYHIDTMHIIPCMPQDMPPECHCHDGFVVDSVLSLSR